MTSLGQQNNCHFSSALSFYLLIADLGYQGYIETVNYTNFHFVFYKQVTNRNGTYMPYLDISSVNNFSSLQVGHRKKYPLTLA